MVLLHVFSAVPDPLIGYQPSGSSKAKLVQICVFQTSECQNILTMWDS